MTGALLAMLAAAAAMAAPRGLAAVTAAPRGMAAASGAPVSTGAAAATAAAAAAAAGATAAAAASAPASMPASAPASMPASAPAESAPIIPPEVLAHLPEVSAAATPKEVLIADPVRYELHVKHLKAYIINLPAAPAFGDFEVLPGDRTHVAKDLDAANVEETFVLQLAAFKTGELSVASLEVPFLTASGDKYFVATPALPVKVKSLVANVTDPALKDVRAPLPLVEEDTFLLRLLLVVAGALAVAGLALLAGWKARGFFVKPPPPPPPPRPAHEVALEKLGAIERDQLIERGLADAFALRTSETVREYLEGQFGFPALEFTTDELLEELRRTPRAGLSFDPLRRFLQETDLVKFARYPASEPVMREHLAVAYDTVRRTMPLEAPPPGAAPPAATGSGPGGASATPPTSAPPSPASTAPATGTPAAPAAPSVAPEPRP
jgi:hypothetical protein